MAMCSPAKSPFSFKKEKALGERENTDNILPRRDQEELETERT